MAEISITMEKVTSFHRETMIMDITNLHSLTKTTNDLALEIVHNN